MAQQASLRESRRRGQPKEAKHNSSCTTGELPLLHCRLEMVTGDESSNVRNGLDLGSTSSEWATNTYKITLHVRGLWPIQMQATSERGKEPQACCTVQPVLVDYHMSSAADLNRRLAVRTARKLRQVASPGAVPATC